MLYINTEEILDRLNSYDRVQIVRECEEFYKSDFRKALVDIVPNLELESYYNTWFIALPEEKEKIIKSIKNLNNQLLKVYYSIT